jgi:hypothetical protein
MTNLGNELSGTYSRWSSLGKVATDRTRPVAERLAAMNTVLREMGCDPVDERQLEVETDRVS